MAVLTATVDTVSEVPVPEVLVPVLRNNVGSAAFALLQHAPAGCVVAVVVVAAVVGGARGPLVDAAELRAGGLGTLAFSALLLNLLPPRAR